MDEPLSLGAYQRPDGQYIITSEDDYQAKTLMYRWNANNLPATTPPAAPTDVTGTGANMSLSLSWSSVSGALTYQVSRTVRSGGPYTIVGNGLITPTFMDTGLTNGQTYYYVVQVLTETGTSRNSTQVSVTPAATSAPK